MYPPTSSLTDPPTYSPIADGVAWVQGAALGSIATTVAVVAVATIGLLMLFGRLEVRRGITVVVGCFLVFGADIMGATITGLAVDDVAPRALVARNPSRPVRVPRATVPPMTSYDPYAGASVPVRR